MPTRLFTGALALGLVAVPSAAFATNDDEREVTVQLIGRSDPINDVYQDAQGGEEDGIPEVGDRNVWTETLYWMATTSALVPAHHPAEGAPPAEVPDPAHTPDGFLHIDCVVSHIIGTVPPEWGEGGEVTELPEGFDVAQMCDVAFELPDGTLYGSALVRWSDFEPPDLEVEPPAEVPTSDPDAHIHAGILGGDQAHHGASGSMEARFIFTDESGLPPVEHPEGEPAPGFPEPDTLYTIILED